MVVDVVVVVVGWARRPRPIRAARTIDDDDYDDETESSSAAVRSAIASADQPCRASGRGA